MESHQRGAVDDVRVFNEKVGRLLGLTSIGSSSLSNTYWCEMRPAGSNSKPFGNW